MLKTIKRDEIKSNLDSDANMILVEALPEQYFNAQHLPGAININHDQIEILAPELLADKNAMIVVYCSNNACQNSGIAAKKLIGLGYTDVYKYAEGKQDWIEAGLPVELD
jgi:rhodanese-related sulfurtransferase